MDKLRLKDVENLLGIYPPFFIKEIGIDENKDSFLIRIDEESSRSKLSIRSRFRENPTAKTYRWKHTQLGRYATQIEFKTTPSGFKRLTTPVFPSFLGKPDSEYTVQLCDSVLLGHSKKLDPKTISELTGSQEEIVKRIILAAESDKLDNQASSLLPLETDPIWIRIIKSEFPLKTKSNPLRMLLHKLELAELKGEGSLQESISTLRAFFIKNKARLKSEYQQIGAKNDALPQTQPRQKSLKPDHPVWENILNGSVSIISSNLAFNLYITRLKDLYKDDLALSEKREIVIDMMKYLKKNMTNLKAELLSIKRLSQSLEQESRGAEVPDAHHNIWIDILDDKVSINTQRINLSLLLVKIKGQRGHVSNEQCAEELRQFFVENQRTMKTEVAQINQLVRQAV